VEKDNDAEVRPHYVTEEELKAGGGGGGDLQYIAELSGIVEAEGPVGVFQLCINPGSFSQTVENFFHLSCLMSECRAASDIDENGELFVYSCVQPTPGDNPQRLPKRQAAWQLDHDTWKLAIESYNIMKPMIPTRLAPEEHTYAFYGR